MSVLKGEKEILVKSEKRALDEVRDLTERVHRLQVFFPHRHIIQCYGLGDTLHTFMSSYHGDNFGYCTCNFFSLVSSFILFLVMSMLLIWKKGTFKVLSYDYDFAPANIIV